MGDSMKSKGSEHDTIESTSQMDEDGKAGDELNNPGNRENLDGVVTKLNERVKELNCFYRISNIMKSKDSHVDETLKKIINCIPPAMQYPKYTGVRLQLGDVTFLSDNFTEGKWKMRRDLVVNEKLAGAIEIWYLEGIPSFNGSPFLFEEGKLIDSLTEIIEKFLEKKELKEAMEDQKQQLDALMDKHIKDYRDDAEGDNRQPDWEIMINLLIKSNPSLLFRISRKMLYFLSRTKNESLENLMMGLNCSLGHESDVSEWCGINMPNPKKDIDALQRVQENVFEIARNTLAEEEISSLVSLWLQHEKARPLVMTAHRRGVPLVEVIDTLTRFKDIMSSDLVISPEDDISIRTNFLRRFFTERLDFINAAKQYVKIADFIFLLDKIIGPSRGSGKLGGKAAGVFLAEKIIRKEMEKDDILNDVSFARSWYLTSDTLWEFIHYNALDDISHIKYIDPNDIRGSQPYLEQVFKNGAFPNEIVEGFSRVLREIGDKPIIVRSSSLLEDSFGSAFSGKYKSLFLANTGSPIERLSALMDAVGEIYASVFSPDPIEYRRERGLIDFDEEMGIIIQEVVGTRIGPYFMPVFAGVALSNNEFRWSPRIQREDGMIRLVAGLGTRAVDRVADNYPVLVSPNRPEIKVNALVEETIQYSQQQVDVINLENGIPETIDLAELFKKYGGEYPLLEQLVSIYSGDQLKPPMGMLFDPESSDLIVTFTGIMEKGPFIPQMKKILALLKEKLGTPVDVEFAHDGKNLYVLQCRPQSQSTIAEKVTIPKNIVGSRKVFSAKKYVTTGEIRNIEYMVYVKAKAYEELENIDDMRTVARIVSELNKKLPRRKFILMGPGRWGSRGDIKLGVPINYRDINNTSLLIEIGRKKGNQLPDLSFGTHFFQDLVEANIQYLPLYPDVGENIFNEGLLNTSINRLGEMVPHFQGFEHVVRVIRIADISSGGTLTLTMDGDANEALAYLVPPDHWVWRMQKVDEIAKNLNSKKYGVVDLFVFGSTNEGTAEAESDIDLLVHIRGTKEQQADLKAWFTKWDRRLIIENTERTGINIPYILDVHFLTDQDILEKSSWAVHINSPHGAAKKLTLN